MECQTAIRLVLWGREQAVQKLCRVLLIRQICHSRWAQPDSSPVYLTSLQVRSQTAESLPWYHLQAVVMVTDEETSEVRVKIRPRTTVVPCLPHKREDAKGHLCLTSEQDRNRRKRDTFPSKIVMLICWPHKSQASIFYGLHRACKVNSSQFCSKRS